MHVRVTRLSMLFSMFVLFGVARADGPDPLSFKVESNLKIAVAKVDISPKDITRTTGHIRDTKGFRDKLFAVILILDDGRTQAAIVTHDLISSSPAVTEGFRAAVNDATNIPFDHIMVAASHNHSAPKFEQHPEWSRSVLQKVYAAVEEAVKSKKVVNIGYGIDTIDFGINRRQMIGGKAVVRLNPDGPNDTRVKVLRFDDGESIDPVAVMMHAVCHPCVLTWGDKWSEPYPNGYPKMSADFPGVGKGFVEKVYGERTTALFLQGCAGDIRPNLPGHPYRCGDEADMMWCGRGLGCAAVRASDKSAIREELRKRPTIYPIRSVTETIQLPSIKSDAMIECEIQALKVGPYLFLTLPGEPMVDYGFQIEKAIGDRAIPIVVGYANGSIGYICTDEAHREGGYEPNHSATGSGTEPMLIKQSLRLADIVIADVFEHFAPTKQPKK